MQQYLVIIPDYGVAFGAALLFGITLTPAARALALRTRAFAIPVSRSVHKAPIPYFGGLALYAAVALAVLLTVGWEHVAVQALIVVGAGLVLLGVWDDVRGMPAVFKLAGQTAAALTVVGMGVRVEWLTNPMGGLIFLGIWSIPLTVIWIVAIINVMNLIDGLDGLAAGITGIAAGTLLIIALLIGQPDLAVILAAALAGSALGFLPYNFNPAKIIMGDAGSMFLGLALAVIAIEGMMKGPTAIALAVPLLVLGLPIADTMLAVWRRLRQGQSIAAPDQGHVHHRLLQLGLSHRDAVLVLYFVSGWLGISALAVSQMGSLQATLVVSFVVITAYFAARRLGVLAGRTGSELRNRWPTS